MERRPAAEPSKAEAKMNQRNAGLSAPRSGVSRRIRRAPVTMTFVVTYDRPLRRNMSKMDAYTGLKIKNWHLNRKSHEILLPDTVGPRAEIKAADIKVKPSVQFSDDVDYDFEMKTYAPSTSPVISQSKPSSLKADRPILDQNLAYDSHLAYELQLGRHEGEIDSEKENILPEATVILQQLDSSKPSIVVVSEDIKKSTPEDSSVNFTANLKTPGNQQDTNVGMGIQNRNLKRKLPGFKAFTKPEVPTGSSTTGQDTVTYIVSANISPKKREWDIGKKKSSGATNNTSAATPGCDGSLEWPDRYADVRKPIRSAHATPSKNFASPLAMQERTFEASMVIPESSSLEFPVEIPQLTPKASSSAPPQTVTYQVCHNLPARTNSWNLKMNRKPLNARLNNEGNSNVGIIVTSPSVEPVVKYKPGRTKKPRVPQTITYRVTHDPPQRQQEWDLGFRKAARLAPQTGRYQTPGMINYKDYILEDPEVQGLQIKPESSTERIHEPKVRSISYERPDINKGFNFAVRKPLISTDINETMKYHGEADIEPSQLELRSGISSVRMPPTVMHKVDCDQRQKVNDWDIEMRNQPRVRTGEHFLPSVINPLTITMSDNFEANMYPPAMRVGENFQTSIMNPPALRASVNYQTSMINSPAIRTNVDFHTSVQNPSADFQFSDNFQAGARPMIVQSRAERMDFSAESPVVPLSLNFKSESKFEDQINVGKDSKFGSVGWRSPEIKITSHIEPKVTKPRRSEQIEGKLIQPPETVTFKVNYEEPKVRKMWDFKAKRPRAKATAKVKTKNKNIAVKPLRTPQSITYRVEYPLPQTQSLRFKPMQPSSELHADTIRPYTDRPTGINIPHASAKYDIGRSGVLLESPEVRQLQIRPGSSSVRLPRGNMIPEQTSYESTPRYERDVQVQFPQVAVHERKQGTDELSFGGFEQAMRTDAHFPERLPERMNVSFGRFDESVGKPQVFVPEVGRGDFWLNDAIRMPSVKIPERDSLGYNETLDIRSGTPPERMRETTGDAAIHYKEPTEYGGTNFDMSMPIAASPRPIAAPQTMTYRVTYDMPKQRRPWNAKTKKLSTDASGAARVSTDADIFKSNVSKPTDASGLRKTVTVPVSVTYQVNYDLPEKRAILSLKKKKAQAKIMGGTEVGLFAAENVRSDTRTLPQERVHVDISKPSSPTTVLLSSKQKEEKIPVVVTYLVNHDQPKTHREWDIKMKPSVTKAAKFKNPKVKITKPSVVMKIKHKKQDAVVQDPSASTEFQRPKVDFHAGKTVLAFEKKAADSSIEVPMTMTYIVTHEQPSGLKNKNLKEKKQKNQIPEKKPQAFKTEQNKFELEAYLASYEREPINISLRSVSADAVIETGVQSSIPQIDIVGKVENFEVPNEFAAISDKPAGVTYVVSYNPPVIEEFEDATYEPQLNLKTDEEIRITDANMHEPLRFLETNLDEILNMKEPAHFEILRPSPLSLQTTETSTLSVISEAPEIPTPESEPAHIDLSAVSMPVPISIKTPKVKESKAISVKPSKVDVKKTKMISPRAPKIAIKLPEDETLSVKAGPQAVTYTVMYDAPTVWKEWDLKMKKSRPKVASKSSSEVDVQLKKGDTSSMPLTACEVQNVKIKKDAPHAILPHTVTYNVSYDPPKVRREWDIKMKKSHPATSKRSKSADVSIEVKEANIDTATAGQEPQDLKQRSGKRQVILPHTVTYQVKYGPPEKRKEWDIKLQKPANILQVKTKAKADFDAKGADLPMPATAAASKAMKEATQLGVEVRSSEGPSLIVPVKTGRAKIKDVQHAVDVSIKPLAEPAVKVSSVTGKAKSKAVPPVVAADIKIPEMVPETALKHDITTKTVAEPTSVTFIVQYEVPIGKEDKRKLKKEANVSADISSTPLKEFEIKPDVKFSTSKGTKASHKLEMPSRHIEVIPPTPTSADIRVSKITKVAKKKPIRQAQTMTFIVQYDMPIGQLKQLPAASTTEKIGEAKTKSARIAKDTSISVAPHIQITADTAAPAAPFVKIATDAKLPVVTSKKITADMNLPAASSGHISTDTNVPVALSEISAESSSQPTTSVMVDIPALEVSQISTKLSPDKKTESITYEVNYKLPTVVEKTKKNKNDLTLKTEEPALSEGSSKIKGSESVKMQQREPSLDVGQTVAVPELGKQTPKKKRPEPQQVTYNVIYDVITTKRKGKKPKETKETKEKTKEEKKEVKAKSLNPDIPVVVPPKTKPVVQSLRSLAAQVQETTPRIEIYELVKPEISIQLPEVDVVVGIPAPDDVKVTEVVVSQRTLFAADNSEVINISDSLTDLDVDLKYQMNLPQVGYVDDLDRGVSASGPTPSATFVLAVPDMFADSVLPATPDTDLSTSTLTDGETNLDENIEIKPAVIPTITIEEHQRPAAIEVTGPEVILPISIPSTVDEKSSLKKPLPDLPVEGPHSIIYVVNYADPVRKEKKHAEKLKINWSPIRKKRALPKLTKSAKPAKETKEAHGPVGSIVTIILPGEVNPVSEVTAAEPHEQSLIDIQLPNVEVPAISMEPAEVKLMSYAGGKAIQAPIGTPVVVEIHHVTPAVDNGQPMRIRAENIQAEGDISEVQLPTYPEPSLDVQLAKESSIENVSVQVHMADDETWDLQPHDEIVNFDNQQLGEIKKDILPKVQIEAEAHSPSVVESEDEKPTTQHKENPAANVSQPSEISRPAVVTSQDDIIPIEKIYPEAIALATESKKAPCIQELQASEGTVEVLKVLAPLIQSGALYESPVRSREKVTYIVRYDEPIHEQSASAPSAEFPHPLSSIDDWGAGCFGKPPQKPIRFDARQDKFIVKPTLAVTPHVRSKSDDQCVLLKIPMNDVTPEPPREFSGLQKAVTAQFVVVAIDFGTTHSGYAFRFTRDVGESIHIMRQWEGGDPGAVDYKTLSTLLLTPEGKFHSFGFAARDFFHDLSPEEALRWMYFEKFKMALHSNSELSVDTELAASNGQRLPALLVFSYALRFFKDHALQELGEQSLTRLVDDDVKWILTVPAIWKSPAKQFMRRAAYQAGIASPDNPDQLLISLEPEAASVSVRREKFHELVPDSPPFGGAAPFQRARRGGSAGRRSATPGGGGGRRSATPVGRGRSATPDRGRRYSEPREGESVAQASLSPGSLSVNWPSGLPPLPPMSDSQIYSDTTVGQEVNVQGTRYMVLDCGGGTVDITVHEIESNEGSLHEVYRATGGPFGSLGVDREFEKLLVDIFGSDFIDAFKRRRPAGWVDLMMAFESRKRAADPYRPKPLNVSLPFSFTDYHKKFRTAGVETAVSRYADPSVVWSRQGMLRLLPAAMERLFTPTLRQITATVDSVINEPGVTGIKFMFLVGGFAESPMLQLAMRRNFGHLVKILIPYDVSLAILKGAVSYGCDPSVVTRRKSRLTYGVAVHSPFDRRVHPKSKLTLRDNAEYCADVFDPLVLTDQSVAVGESVSRHYTLVVGAHDERTSKIHIYASESRRVQFTTDAGVTKCGTLCLELDAAAGGGAVKEGGVGKEGVAATGESRRVVSGQRDVQLRMTFGNTEINVAAIDTATGRCIRAAIDFLNR